ncbi:MAG: type II secretion system minor pseudopilin GspJ [Sideroxydans sp.]|nr:type II secretion system minor pseudopilin GspJ [Sideroxydans sp.]
MIGYRTRRGFTLIELLVALFIFSLLAIAGYRGLTALLQTRAQLDVETRKYQTLTRFFSRMDEQLAQVINRPVRVADGTSQAALVGFPVSGGELEEAQIVFTRAGGLDMAGGVLPPQRIGYRLRNNAVQMLRWDVLDQAPNSKPAENTVLEGVREFNLRYLSLSMVWEKQWALVSPTVPPPKAVEVEVVLTTGEKILRVFSLQ